MTFACVVPSGFLSRMTTEKLPETEFWRAVMKPVFFWPMMAICLGFYSNFCG
jgi:hypothetical protein